MDSEDEFEESCRGVPATIVLINIFDPSSSKTAQIAYGATCGMVRQYLRDSTSQCVSVCFFGTEENVVDVFPLGPPTLDDFKKLEQINLPNLNQAKELVMSEALRHCNTMFKNCTKLLSTRTIIILSRLNAPPMQTDQKPALKTVEDLLDDSVYLKLINISETNYQIDQFYKDFLETCKGRDEILPSPIQCEKEIEKLMLQHSHRHLAVAKLSFEIGNELNIGVGVYSLLKAQGQTRHKTSNLDMETNSLVSTINKTVKVSINAGNEMDVDGNEQDQPSNQVPILKSEILHFQEFGGKRVEFTDSEMKALKNPFGPPMLKLLGFKPQGLLCKEKWFLKRTYFLFPNDDIIEGSTIAFKALHQACVETEMVAICVLCTRANSRPMNVALAPCKHPLGLNICTGFDVICIPFVENVRDIPNFDDDEEMDTSSVEKNVMKKMVHSIKFDYMPNTFENPKLQSIYRAVEAIALNKLEDELEPLVDTTKPNPEQFQNIDDELFYKVFGPFVVAPAKRVAAANSADCKKIKLEEIDMSLLQSRKENGKISQYTVPELKEILKSKEIPELPALTGLKKAQLIQFVFENF